MHFVKIVEFVMPVVILLSLVIKTHFHGGEFEITVSNIAFAIGMIAGSMLLYIRNFKTHKAKIEMWSYAFFGSFFIISGLLPENFFWPFAIIMGIIGVVMSITQSASMALMQEKIPQEKLGRVLSLYMGLASIPSIIGLLVANDLIKIFGGVMNLIIFSGIGYVVVAILLIFNRPVHAMIADDIAAESKNSQKSE